MSGFLFEVVRGARVYRASAPAAQRAASVRNRTMRFWLLGAIGLLVAMLIGVVNGYLTLALVGFPLLYALVGHARQMRRIAIPDDLPARYWIAIVMLYVAVFAAVMLVLARVLYVMQLL